MSIENKKNEESEGWKPSQANKRESTAGFVKARMWCEEQKSHIRVREKVILVVAWPITQELREKGINSQNENSLGIPRNLLNKKLLYFSWSFPPENNAAVPLLTLFIPLKQGRY